MSVGTKSGETWLQVDGNYIPPDIGYGGGESTQRKLAKDAQEAWEMLLNRTGAAGLGFDPEAFEYFPGMNLDINDVYPWEPSITRAPSARGLKGFAEDLSRMGEPESWAWPRMGEYVDYVDPFSREQTSTWVRYNPAYAGVMFREMDPGDRADFYNQAVAAGWLPKQFKGETEFTLEGVGAFKEGLSLANVYGKSLSEVLGLYSQLNARTGGGGRKGPTFKAEVPTYETLVQTAKELIRRQLGREPKEWEMGLIADEFDRQYGRWAEAQKRMTLGGNGVYEVPDPATETMAFFEETYAPEIQRLQSRAETQINNRMFMDNLARGSEVMASSPTYGGPSA